MKKLSKITLAKAYDVLSESEMKSIVGGDHPDSGSGAMYTCYHTWTKDDGTPVTTKVAMIWDKSAEDAHSGFCMQSSIDNCAKDVYCE